MIGTKLGAFDILGLLGEGGMGQVYKARDTRLNRTVAIKVLPSHFSNNPEMKARFDREAQTIAGLNHPNICVLYDVGHQDGTDYLVMEYLEGQTLAQRLEKGALPLDEALKIAIELADALDKAHRQGVVHRDLKPGNVMLTKSGAKLLDFGLAKLRQETQPSTLSALPTNADVTAKGTILGTLQYMAPEQLEDGQVDTRTDIFAFGSVLYEIVTGRKAFQGKSQMSVIGAILKDTPPPVSMLQPVAPALLDRIISRCLEKDPENRWQSARDVQAELSWVAETQDALPSTSQRTVHGWFPKFAWLAVCVALAVPAVVFTTVYLPSRNTTPSTAIRKFAIVVPPSIELTVENLQNFNFSRDAKQIVFAGRSGGRIQLYRRMLDEFETLPVTGTDGASQPFFSPDGQWIGFLARGQLKKIAVTGGTPVVLCDVQDIHEATWGTDDNILFSKVGSGLFRVPAGGGTPQSVTKVDIVQGETEHEFPEILPGGQAVLFTAAKGYLDTNVAVYSQKTGQHRILFKGLKPRFVPTGHIVFARVGGSLWAIPFDPGRLEVTGAAVPILEGIRSEFGVWPYFAIGSDGTLAYVPGSPLKQLVWLDRKGEVEQLGFAARPYESPRISSDGRSLAATVREENHDVWTFDLDRGTSTRMTNAPGEDETPVWIAARQELVYAGDSPGGTRLVKTTMAGISGAQVLLQPDGNHRHTDSVSPDGRQLAFTEFSRETGADIWILPLEGDHRPQPFLQTASNESEARFSPDGRWIAYISNESGRNEVYVQAYPGHAGKLQISSDGGEEPVWSHDGRELFYRNTTKMMAAEIVTGPALKASKPRLLFDGRYENLSWEPNYDVSADAQKFLMLKSLDNTPPNQINIVLNWYEELKRRAGSGAKIR